MEGIENRLIRDAASFGIELDTEQAARFQIYLELLTQWNEKINLTAITQPEEVAVKHFLDSLLLLSAAKPQQGARLLDVGTGAGFPGVPVKIVRGDLRLTLLDSLNKRLLFLQELCTRLGLSAELVHLRAEEGGRRKDLRGQFDLVTARAVAPLNLLCEYCLPYVRVGGLFAAMKGPDPAGELAAAQNAISLLGARVSDVKSFTLPDGSGRSIILLEKMLETSDKYPRHGAKIAKNPL